MSRARIVCLLLATCLLCGCVNLGDSSRISSAATESAESAFNVVESAIEETPKDEGNEPWREYYAEVAISSLYSDPGMRANNITLFHNFGEIPLLVMDYTYIGDDADWQGLYRAWKYENDGARLVYEGNDYVAGVKADTGNPVVCSQHIDEESHYSNYVEHYSGQTTVLLEEINEYQYDGTIYHSLIDESTWTSEDDPHNERFSDFFVRQDETLPLTYEYYDPESVYSDFDPTEKIRDFLGVSGWRPAVPTDAPQWVGDYISLLHNHLFFSYYPDRAVNIAEEGLHAGDWEDSWTGVALLEPPEAGGDPILAGNFVAPSYSMGYTHVIRLEDRMLLLADDPDGGFGFYKDTQNRYIIRRQVYTVSVWSTIGEYDLSTLFRSGYSYLWDPQYAYLDDEFVEFGPENYENTELAMAWVEDKVQNKLDELGYTELLDWPQIEIHLPEIATWNEIESILVVEFCNYARELGQM